ncbi:OOP family OmpA-OmpF porin [Dyadobacter jejuensis]|uniref:OOP family OmpA-OmpF porin n=1 Tax=Dyadobacter jejuensis TaxID=1082580 RepID=A0A316AH98_9BACT|nr:OmpA family protein [Dyadobacter jejuensis]PWJ57115.1 OOP family OmpA-OmpF porin [Dyadobacter jejuensis]
MLKKSAFWWSTLIIWMAVAIYWHVCHVKQNCEAIGLEIPTLFTNKESPIYSVENTPAQKQASIDPMALSFEPSKETPIENSGTALLDSIAGYLRNHPNQRLTIEGNYHTAEETGTASGHLGLARAKQIKARLTAMGVDSTVMIIAYDSSYTDVLPKEPIQDGIRFRYSTREALTEKDLATDERFTSIFNKIELYFPYASVNYIQTEENQKFLQAAKQYLTQAGSKKLILTGHTDNEDSAEWNLQLSIKRANAVKAKLMAMGIPAEKMTVVGKGETQPKASNSTLQGRRANRRVTLIVQ